MKRPNLIIDIILMILAVFLMNASALSNAVFYHHPDAALYESIQDGEDEMRYIAKIREAAEGHWLMGNPFLREHRDDFFSPSGFVEWIPAALLRMLHGNMGLVLLLTDILFSAITMILTRMWLGKLITNPWIIWSAMFLLFFSRLGGSLDGLLRDVVPKFVQPLASLYLILLTLPSRNSMRQTMLRGTLIGCMFYTYPYHWSLFLVTEGVFAIYKTIIVTSGQRLGVSHFFVLIKNGLIFFLPFAILAAPMAWAMRTVLSRPEFLDFYDRYHIVFTRIPAAPKLQFIVLLAIIALAVTIWSLRRYRALPATQTINEFLPLLLPLTGMMILLNANIITGKDPELLGHGGRVIMSVITVAYAVIADRLLPKRIVRPIAALFLIFLIGFIAQKALFRLQTLNDNIISWESSPEKSVLDWMNTHLPEESVIAAPRTLSEKIPIFTSHYTQFAAGAHFFFVSLDEVTERYLAWVGLYPNEKELTDTATVIIFGSHPGGQWSKERTIARLLGQPFTKSMADYIHRQDLRIKIDMEHAMPNDALNAKRLKQYDTEVIVMPANGHMIASLTQDFRKETVIGPYTVWMRKDVFVKP